MTLGTKGPFRGNHTGIKNTIVGVPNIYFVNVKVDFPYDCSEKVSNIYEVNVKAIFPTIVGKRCLRLLENTIVGKRCLIFTS
jgi:hypothetical protein